MPPKNCTKTLPVFNPATEQEISRIALGDAADVGEAVNAAKGSYETWSTTPVEERLRLLRRLAECYRERQTEMGTLISEEMGAPLGLATKAQAPAGLYHIESFISVLESFPFEEVFAAGGAGTQERLVHEPIGVCGLITPWNWPMNQVTLKVVPALAAGCTCVLKPSEVAPLSSALFAALIDEAGFPDGVFNMVHGDGPSCGAALAAHPDVDLISFTGSTRAGVAVSKAAADGIKRVTLELGGKGANLLFADAAPDVRTAVERGVRLAFLNSGQSCNAPSRMLVERSIYDEVVEIASRVAKKQRVGEPTATGSHIGPVATAAQFDKVQRLIQAGIDEGARLVCGGVGRPAGTVGMHARRPGRQRARHRPQRVCLACI